MPDTASLSSPAPSEEPRELALLPLLEVAARRWRTLASVAVLTALVTVAVALMQGGYVAESKFIPQVTEPQLSRLSGIAAQFGFDLGGSYGDLSLEFYGALLKSREVLRRVAEGRYRFPASTTNGSASDTLEGTILELYEIDGDTHEARLLEAVDVLDEHVSVGIDVKAGVISLRTTAPWAGLAIAINQRLLDLVNEFNLQTRQSQARKEREFVEARMRDAQRELEAAEEGVASFLERNRRFQDSPQLSFEVARLQRRLDLRQQVFTSLSQAYEKARIDEVRDTPVLTVMDNPEGSARSNVHLFSAALLGALIGGTAALTIALGVHSVAEYRKRHPSQFAHLQHTLMLLPVVGWWARHSARRGRTR